jgi:hypothetical protein
MKTVSTLLAILLSIAISAQTVTVNFQKNNNKPKSYQVMIDGVSYFSANSASTNGKQITTINNLSSGAHTLELYSISNSNTSGSDGSTIRPSTRPVYSKTFQLRGGYDMNINVKGSGQVSFTEKRSQKTNTASSHAPMTTTAFNQLVKNINAKRYQSDRITLVKNALSANANYFTSAQVRQLITPVTAESRRLELAKLSYSKVTDPYNFSSIYDLLNSESNRDALDSYVVAQGGSIESNQNNTAYGTVMTESSFNTLLNKVRSYNYQSGRIAQIQAALETTSYFSVPQIRELLTLVTSETDRLSLVKQAYNHVLDRSYFNQLADLFYQTANRTEFNNFISSNGGVASNTTYATAMSDAAFRQIYNKAGSHFFEKNSVAEIKTAFATTSNYFSTEQIKTLIELVSNETTRLELAKLGYPRVVDPVNYYGLADLFTIQSNRDALENYIRSK